MPQDSVSRRDALGLLAGASAALLLPGCARAGASLPLITITASDLLEQIARRLLELNPEQATGLGVDTGALAGLRGRLADRSPAGIARQADVLRADLARVEALSTAGLTSGERTALAVVRSAFATALDGLALPYGDVAVGGWRNAPYVVIQNVGAYLDVPRFLESDHPVRTAADAEAYLSRLAAMADQLDGELARMRQADAAGLVPPDFLLDTAIAQVRRTLADAGQGGQLVRALTARTGAIPGEWESRAHAIVRQTVAPALARQLAALEAQRARATNDPGLLRRPHGEAFYAWALRASTTTALAPREIHALGLEELAALHARMDPILRGLGYTQGSVGDRMAAIGRDPRVRFADGDPGRAQIMEMIHQRIDWIKAQMPRAFLRLVPGNLEVRRLPLSEEPGAPVAYGGPGSIDGAIPGKMWINLRTPDLHRRFDLPTLVHHEAIPGHVWQGEYANRLPLIRSILSFNAYSEGWALYAQQLADELGAYEGDPFGQLGYLQSLAFRACRMVVDTGLHTLGWSLEAALDFFVSRNGNNREDMATEVRRYCSWPGQACGYKMGHGEIVRQRAHAMAALGSRFDLRAFNQAVVDGGNVPLDVLGQSVSRYIAEAGA